METRQHLRLLTKLGLPMKGLISQRNIAHSKNKPFTFIDKEFNQLEILRVNNFVETVNVYKIIKDGILKNCFSEVHTETKRLCLPEAQIPMFCIGHSNWLADSQFGSTFFLFNSKIKEVECICIAQVIKKQRLYHVYFDLLKNIDDIVFEHKNEYKIVVPVI